ncbi:hypothetical protein HBI56_202850 [Parastagonospora nodorum]|nr:hypothetical protein HBI10_137790 [Parastagonospora nodorum]KAH4020423.1 hypothetical protein HBI13_114650 [Parastagonospora nodorum]KAH4031465.1 hypothetical protein HBI09_125140 [Parastagonospora nodorum]KAH4220971.1 hypothetical protein HBI06_162240 [Parastagonospora nodorum]KAH4247772.1 hypothetical protein HBI05_031850 [Parastagonospora nodorum]
MVTWREFGTICISKWQPRNINILTGPTRHPSNIRAAPKLCTRITAKRQLLAAKLTQLSSPSARTSRRATHSNFAQVQLFPSRPPDIHFRASEPDLHRTPHPPSTTAFRGKRPTTSRHKSARTIQRPSGHAVYISPA